jgi:hypothetical protein
LARAERHVMIPPMKSACVIVAASLSASLTARIAPALSGLTGSGQSSGYQDLVSLFNDWRVSRSRRSWTAFPIYTAAAMAAQQRDVAAYQRRLAAIDPSGWPVSQQVDWHIVAPR